MTGLRSVSSWRCRCGVSLKVVAEGNANPQTATDTAVVTCPRCQHEERIFANRIISVTEEKTSLPHQG